MIIASIFVVAFSLLVVFAACKVSSDCAREEEKQEQAQRNAETAAKGINE